MWQIHEFVEPGIDGAHLDTLAAMICYSIAKFSFGGCKEPFSSFMPDWSGEGRTKNKFTEALKGKAAHDVMWAFVTKHNLDWQKHN